MVSEDIGPHRAEDLSYATVAPRAQREILIHAVIAGLTPVIPLPFVDDWARNGIQTRMVRRIAKVHGKQLYASDENALGKESGRYEGLIHGAGKKLAFVPIRRLFRTAFFVLMLKDIVDVSSRTYHTGYLIDHAIGRGLHGAVKAERLRTAIDDACREADTSPVRRAFTSVFTESRDLLERAKAQPRSGPREVEALADRLQRAINILPPRHFLDLRAAFDKALNRDGA